VLLRSAALEEQHLPQVGSLEGTRRLGFIQLPKIGRGRGIALSFAASGTGPEARVRLVLARDVGEVDAQLAFLRALLIGGAVAATLLSVISGSVIVSQGLAPLDALGRSLEAINEEQFELAVPAESLPAELRPIARRLGSLLRRLEEAFDRERRFSGDVAHELRTPLAGLRSILEVTAARERSPEEYRVALLEAHEITLQLDGMVGALLLLQRLEAGLVEARPEPQPCRELIRRAWEARQERSEAKAQRLDNSVPPELLALVDEELLLLLLGVVLENAIAHGPEGAAIQALGRERGEDLELSFRNGGCKLPGADAHRVFDRFWRGDASRQAGHTGLGLALAARAVRRLGGSVSAEVEAEEFCLNISLPAAKLESE